MRDSFERLFDAREDDDKRPYRSRSDEDARPISCLGKREQQLIIDTDFEDLFG